MKARIYFEYEGKPYQFTIDSENVDLTHYEGMWDAWFDSTENELNHDVITKEDNLIFEVNGEKAFFPKGWELIGVEDIEVFVYNDDDADSYKGVVNNMAIKVTMLDDYDVFKALKIGAKVLLYDEELETENEYVINQIGEFETNEELAKFQKDGNRIYSDTIISLAYVENGKVMSACEVQPHEIDVILKRTELQMEEKETNNIIKGDVTLEDVEKLEINYRSLYTQDKIDYFLPNLRENAETRKRILFRFEALKGTDVVARKEQTFVITSFPTFVDYLIDMVTKKDVYRDMTITCSILFQDEIKPNENDFIWNKKEGKWETYSLVILTTCTIGKKGENDNLYYDNTYIKKSED